MATESTKTTTDKTSAADESAPEETSAPASAAEDRGTTGTLRKGAKTDSADASDEPEDAVGPRGEKSDHSNYSADGADDDLDDADAEREAALDAAERERAAGRGWGAGAAAVVSAGFGLASLTGTSFGEMLRERKQLIGQISSGAQGSGGSATEQVNALYGAPWHAAAVVNGIFAVLAVIVGGILLAVLNGRAGARPWMKAVGLGGLVLGVVGLIVAGGMYFDLFAAQPQVPATGGAGAGAGAGQ
ncbi:hypothetical protein [Streptomyces axinellae]|uniref:Integral membrane protein n=1 Tax=Streptomyces axinellae TaxID=552788 RepID=A0ABP6D3V5_9ACTN